MPIKDLLPVFAQDKLAHYQWASWFAAGSAVAVMLLGGLLLHRPIAQILLMGALGSLVTAGVLGWLGERSDAQANAQAAFDGQDAPHDVSRGDIVASALGCLPSLLPLLAAYAAVKLG